MADQRKIIHVEGGEPAAEPGTDIMGLRSRLAEFEQGAERDALTGLPNRRGFMRALERVVSMVNHYDTQAALLCFEAKASEETLQALAALLSGLVRSSDVVARSGETEFALILDDLDLNSAIETSERVLRCVERSGFGIEIHVGAAAILKGDEAEEVPGRAARNLERAREEA